MHKIIKSELGSQVNAFKPHCFPDITVKYSENRMTGTKKTNDGFRRIFADDAHQLDMTSKMSKEIVGNAGVDAQTRQRMEKIEEHAYTLGFTKGEKEGRLSEEKKIEPVLTNFRQAIFEIEKVKKEIYLNAEKETVDLAMAVAKKIICHEVSTNQGVVLSVVKEALKKVMDDKGVKVKINPSDFEFIENADYQLPNVIDDYDNINFEKDESVSSGGCVIETSCGNIDARIEEQLRVVEKAFKSELKKIG